MRKQRFQKSYSTYRHIRTVWYGLSHTVCRIWYAAQYPLYELIQYSKSLHLGRKNVWTNICLVVRRLSTCSFIPVKNLKILGIKPVKLVLRKVRLYMYIHVTNPWKRIQVLVQDDKNAKISFLWPTVVIRLIKGLLSTLFLRTWLSFSPYST